jgi:CelD/BcsL family acetyltransferase involved in cellulose biosynthesis
MEIIEVQTPETLTTLRAEWDALLEGCPQATIFQSWEWNEAWWHTLGQRQQLFVLQARECGQLVGLAPFCIRRVSGTPLRRLTFLGTGVSDNLDVLAVPERVQEVCTAFLAYLDASQAYDLADWHELQPLALLRQVLVNGPPPRAEWTCRWQLQEPCLTIALPSTWETYVAQLGKLRRNLGYYRRLLKRRCASVEFRLAAQEELGEAMEALFALHQQRWQMRQLSGHLGSRPIQAFHRQVADRFQARGWLRLYLARVQGRIIGVEYGWRFRDRYASYLGGFDPAWEGFRVGTLLIGEAIRQAIIEGCPIFDWLRGSEPHKVAWGARSAWINGRVQLRRRSSLRGWALQGLDAVCPRVAATLRVRRCLRGALQGVRTGVHRIAKRRPTGDVSREVYGA